MSYKARACVMAQLDAYVAFGVGQHVRVFSNDDMSKVVIELQYNHNVTAIEFSPCGRFILAGLENGRLEMRSLAGDTVGRVFQPFGSTIQKVLFGSYGSYDAEKNGQAFLVSGSYDGTLSVWDSVTYECTKTIDLQRNRQDHINGLVFLPGEQEVLAGTSAGQLVVVPIHGNDQPRRINMRARHVTVTALVRVGDAVAVGVMDTEQHLYSRLELRPVNNLDHVIWSTQLGRHAVKDICASPTGRELAIACYSTKVEIVCTATGAILDAPYESMQPVFTLRFSPDGTRLIVGAENDLIESRGLFLEAEKQLKTVLESVDWDAVKCAAGYERDVVRRYLSRLFVFYEK